MKYNWMWICLLAASSAEAATFSTFEFRSPTQIKFQIEKTSQITGLAAGEPQQWIKAFPSGETNSVELGSRVVLQLRFPDQLAQILKSSALKLSREITPNLFILQAPDAMTAATEAQRLSNIEGVISSHPVIRWPAELNGSYASRPNDFYYPFQWNLENRGADGSRTGVDLNVRTAWAISRGLGSTIAIADCGVELSHPDLQSRSASELHFNFNNNTTNAFPFGSNAAFAHGTECAGLALAEQNNSLGMSGLAPEARLASWVIVSNNLLLVSDEKLMDMYQFQSNSISVQSHSWSRVGSTVFIPQSLLESNGIQNAVTLGRNGRGVIMIRSAGNDPSHDGMSSCNDNATTADPRAIAVAAVRIDGRATSYTKPGAPVLVAAPSGDITNGIFTTDLLGTRGANAFNFGPPYQDLNNYVFDAIGFTGTSASAPQIAGIAALMLSANTNLSYRDVQQILALSSQHFDLADPDLRTNGAGLLVSHYLGYGVPDAGVAVRLARNWPSRPLQTSVTVTVTNSVAIPDAGFRALITGTNLNITSVNGAPTWGAHPDSPTSELLLVDAGVAAAPIVMNLTNKAALIKRDATSFRDKINHAANAGAAFAIIYNNSATNPVFSMGQTDFAPIPAIFIPQAEGETLRNYLQTNSALAQLQLNSAEVSFNVTQPLICEQVGLKLTANHPTRGDLRVTLTSPSGTRSILQKLNKDTNSGPNGWTYWSTHHFFEPSKGTWKLAVTDEFETGSGSITTAELIILGTGIVDSDADGLDDNWEITHFSSLNQNPKNDPDKDGYSNAREQVMGTNPGQSEPLQIDLSPWNASLARISWPGSTNFNYEVWSGTNLTSLSLATNLAGRFPETEWFASYTNTQRFVRVVAREAKNTPTLSPKKKARRLSAP